MREFLKGLELDKETIDSIMAEYGKGVQAIKEEKETLSEKVKTYEEEISKLKENSQENEDWKTKFQELDERLQRQDAEAKAKAEDELLTDRITKAFGENEFINELTRKALIGEMKTAIKDENNAGKSDKEIFESLTKNQNVFANPNKPAEIPGMGSTDENSNASRETVMFF